MHRLVAVIAVLALSCFASHSRESSSDDADRPATREDGAVPPAPADSGVRDPTPGPDEPLPAEPEPDPGPDGRPSDDEDAEDWGDAPDLDPDEPCCDPVGEPTDIPIPTSHALGDLALEWNGDGWGMVYAEVSAAFFQELAREGSPLGSLRRLEMSGWGTRLHWSGGRFGVLVSREGAGAQDTAFALLDRRGTLAAGWTDLDAHLGGIGARMGRVEYMNRWIVVQSHYGPVTALELDGSGTIVGELRVSEVGNERSKVVGLKSRAVVFWNGDSGSAFARSLTIPIDESRDEPVRLGPGAGIGRATRLRDRAVWVSDTEGAQGVIASFDPFTGESTYAIVNQLPWVEDAEGLDDHELIAVCTSIRVPGFTSTELQLLNLEGERVGSPVRLAGEEARDCALGVEGDVIYAAWNVEYSSRVRVRGFRLRTAD